MFVIIAVPIVIGMLMLLSMVLFLLAFACVVGLPIYLFGRHWLGQKGLLRTAQQPIDRLKTLYVEGKIDMFEFERRAAALLHVENF